MALRGLVVSVGLLILALPYSVFAGYSSTGPGTWSTTPDQLSMSACIGAAAPGDTINVLAGSATWTTAGVTVTQSLYIIGAGSDQTIITLDSATLNYLITLRLSSDVDFRLSAIGFVLNPYTNTNNYHSALYVDGDTSGIRHLTKVRVDHCSFTYGGYTLYLNGWISGLIDHNTFTDCYQAMMICGDNNYAWNRVYVAGAITPGTVDPLFVEYNTFIRTHLSPVNIDALIYMQSAANVVVRENTFDCTDFTTANFHTFILNTHANWDSLSNGNGGYWVAGRGSRGSPIFEAYNNTITCGTARVNQVFGIRGGSVLIHDNTITGSQVYAPIQLTEEEAWQTALFNPLRTIWPAQDPIMNCFFWNNTLNGASITAISLGNALDGPFIRENYDYWMHAPQSSGGRTYFTGTRWGGSQSLPTAADTGTLVFTSSGANAYYPYTPFGAHPMEGSPSTFTVIPSAGAGGSITPSTPQTITSGQTTTFSVTPNGGYTAAVGGSCGGSLVGYTYTTNPITADCSVSATFISLGTAYFLTPLATGSGVVSPNGIATVYQGNSQTFTFTADAGFRVVNIKVDGVNLTSASSYTFSSVSDNHTLAVDFGSGGVFFQSIGSGGCTLTNAGGLTLTPR